MFTFSELFFVDNFSLTLCSLRVAVFPYECVLIPSFVFSLVSAFITDEVSSESKIYS